jgi:TonB-dependent Receptor Plug Domain
VTLALEGFGTYTEELRVVTGATVERNVVLKVGALAESITVSGESPMVDTRTAAVASTTTREVIENLPIIRTTVTDYVQATPGVSASSPGAYNEQIQVMGSPSNETTYVHDGVVINHVRTGNTWQGSDIDSVEEINTVALGASAEWQSTAGGVVNVVTKSGTNKYEGDYGRSLTIFPILNSPSARVFLRTNRLDYSDKYNGLVASVVKRLSHRWQGQANLKLGKSYDLPKIDVRVSANYQNLSNVPFAPVASVALPQGRRNINIDAPGAFRAERISLLYLRFNKIVQLPAGRKLEFIANLVNALQSEAPTGTGTASYITFNYFSPNYGLPNTWVQPRTLYVGIRANF